MINTRKSLLAVAGVASFASLLSASRVEAEDNAMLEPVEMLIRASETANAALLRGDAETYLSHITLSDDFTLMSPFGGKVGRAPYTRQQWGEIARLFSAGTLRQEVVETYAVDDMVVLAVIEHGHGVVGRLPAQEWPLRVTLVYRRDDGRWKLVHRHADALVHGIGLPQLAALARGETAAGSGAK